MKGLRHTHISSPRRRVIFRHICENLDERLDSSECRAIKAHIDGCHNCAAYLDSLKKTVLLYRSLRIPTLSANQQKSLRAAISAEVLQLSRKKRRARS